jgi:hypothetical protein
MSTAADFKKIQREFTDYLRDPENNSIPNNIEPRRMAIYDELVFNNIEGFLSNGFPVIRSLYDQQQWQQIVRKFILNHQCHSPLFSEITLEFIDYLSANGRYLLERYPFLLELAHYEWVEVAVMYADEENNLGNTRQNLTEISDQQWLSQAPIVSSVMHLLAYEFPVHQISIDNIPLQKSATGVFLAVYRKPNDDVGFMELNALSYRLLESLDGITSGSIIIDNLAKQMGHDNGSELYQPAIEMMRGFMQRNILLGTVCCD